MSKHCDGVEPDNVDGYSSDPGFPLTTATQLDYNRFLATEAHARGLSIGLKNDLDQVTSLVSQFDWALNEECHSFDECGLLSPFISAGKALFHMEYGSASLASSVCPDTKRLGFSTPIRKLELDAFRVACPRARDLSFARADARSGWHPLRVDVFNLLRVRGQRTVRRYGA